MSGFGKMPKTPKFWHLIPLNPRIKICSKFEPCHFLYFINSQLHAKFQKKLMSNSRDIYTTTDQRTNKGDYYRPNQVNLGSKMFYMFKINLY